MFYFSEDLLVNENITILEACWKYIHTKEHILLVVDDNKEFKGIITHKEIYQDGIDPNNKLSTIVNANCKRVQYNADKEIFHNSLREIFDKIATIQSVPIIKNNRVIGLFTRDEFNAMNCANAYLLTNYSIDLKTLDEIIEKHLVNCKKIREVEIDGIKFYFEDCIASMAVPNVANELNAFDEYNYKKINFQKDDIVVDIGGNVGMVSIYLAKKFPFLKIYAYEPVRQNYESFLHNIELNNIPEGTIIVENKAVTGDGRNIDMAINKYNSGSSSISDIITVGTITQEDNTHISSTTLNEIFKTHNIKKLKLLKIDCEGSEYEILRNTDAKYLNNIQSIRGEFHENKILTDEYDIDSLYNFVSQYVKDINVIKTNICFLV